MIVKLLTERHLKFLSITGGCRGQSESTLVKMSNCWKSRALAHITFKDTLTKPSAIYSYVSAPVLNNKFFFANGKILPLFVNQTIAQVKCTQYLFTKQL